MHIFLVKALKSCSRRPDGRANRQPRASTTRTARFVIVASIVVLPLLALTVLETNSVRSNGTSPVYTSEAQSSVSAPNVKKLVVRTDKGVKASVASDKADYAPGDIVTITGNGWKPGEAISLRIHRSDGTPDVVLKAKSDATGRFTNKELVIKRSDLGVSFLVTALGLASKYTADLRFTDANITVSAQNGGSANNSPNGFQTFTLTKQVFTGSANCSTGAGSSTTVNGVGNPSPHTFALNPGDSVTLNAPQMSNQNGLFQGWVSPDGGSFTQVGGSNTICVPGDAAPHTYVAIYNPGLIVLDNTCTSPKTLFNLGETVCVRVFAQPAASFGQMMIQFQDPDGVTRNDPSLFVINADQQTFTFTLPGTNTTGSTDNRGTWVARIVNSTTALSSNALFRVRNPATGQEAADLSVQKSSFLSVVPPNGTIQYEIRLGNEGPDPAQNVTLTDAIPANTTFFSYQQLSGPSFNCNTPAVGGTGTISCTGGTLPVLTLGSGLSDPVNTAVFRLVLKVNVGVADGTLITNTESASSNTFDPRANNNMSSANTTVVATACSLTCQADITAGADTLCSGNPGKVVTFGNPPSTGNCGPITCAPPSGSCFPVGTTTVLCQENSGGKCSFRVIVSPCALTCPANITKSNDPGLCGAVTTYATPGGVGCGTVTCNPPSGSFFPVGTTTVTCTPTTGSPCTFTVTIQDTQPPSITCPANITAATPQNVCSTGGCSVVNFTTPAPNDNCPGANTACTPPSGTCFPTGLTTVTCTTTDASGNTATCSFTVTVFDVCLQDDSNPANVLLFNSQTGSYKFCCGATTFTGTGAIVMKGCTISLTHYAPDRRVTALVDKTQFKGTASLQSPPGTLKCTIMDRDTRNNACACL